MSPAPETPVPKALPVALYHWHLERLLLARQARLALVVRLVQDRPVGYFSPQAIRLPGLPALCRCEPAQLLVIRATLARFKSKLETPTLHKEGI